jgi:hypothetical protein
MAETATRWECVQDIDGLFASASFAYEPDHQHRVSVVMRGERNLRIQFSGVIALRFEDDCPGTFPLPRPLPMLGPRVTFPLLKIEQSNWLAQWPQHPRHVHFVLLTADDLIQLIANPDAFARWE